MVIPQFINGMMKLMMMKFMTNDMPHAAGTIDDWVEDAWNELRLYAGSRGLFVELALKHDVEKFSALGYSGSSTIKKDTRNIKLVLSGYHLIAKGLAVDSIVNHTYNVIHRELKGTIDIEVKRHGAKDLDDLISRERSETGIQGHVFEGYLGALLRLVKLRDAFTNVKDRLDKVVAIEILIHMEHEEGMELMLIIANSLRGGELEYDAIPKLLEMWLRT